MENNYFFTQVYCCSSFYWLLIQSISWANKMTDICNMYTNLKEKSASHYASYKRETVLNTEETFSSFYLQPNSPVPSSL